MNSRPVIRSLRDIIGDKSPKVDLCHPGLWLDKFARPGKQEEQKNEIEQLCKLTANTSTLQGEGTQLLAEVRTRRDKNFRSIGKTQTSFTAQTNDSFTLHLSRASALENAGICLHPVYGFAYIPGTALKGMAHAYACEVWLPSEAQGKSEDEKRKLWEQIIDVFGCAPSPWLDRPNQEDHPGLVQRMETLLNLKFLPEDKKARRKELEKWTRAGAVIFHDAWPLAWPRLICDIVNNHHQKYYNEKEDIPPPGDWEDPNPAYFLAIKAGTEFDFPLSLRPSAVEKETSSESLVKLACQWLLGALEHRGAGAKTNAGYGRFKLCNAPENYSNLREETDNIWKKATDRENGLFREETFTLELVSPAFLAGANQKAKDCDLRPASLRGQLRWWWRTMHSGFLDVATLRKLEEAIWGSAEVGGAILLEIIPKTEIKPELFDKKQIPKKHSLEKPPSQKVTQGLSYLTFGMDDSKKENNQKIRVQRFYAEARNQWDITLNVRTIFNPNISATDVINEVIHSLYLFCTYGGIGAKSRKGLGSLAIPEKLFSLTTEKCRESAEKFRKGFLQKSVLFDKGILPSPSINNMIEKEIKTIWKSPWYTIDQLGFSYQNFTQSKKHQNGKKALGLPRRIGAPINGQFNPTGPMRNFGSQTRHSSPFFFHLDRNSDKTYSIRITAFPSPYLPDLETSTELLTKLLNHLKKDLENRVDNYKDKGQTPPHPATPLESFTKGTSHTDSQISSLPKASDKVEAVLLEGKTNKGKWKAQHKDSDLSGVIQNSGDVSADKKPGDTIQLIVKYANEREIAFRYPTTSDEQHTKKNKDKKQHKKKG